jgi:predicted RNA-binding Zn ribbon-like protein
MTMRHDADDFFWVGNHPGLDLVNTEAVNTRGDRLELVTDAADLIDWATAAELIDADLAESCRAAGDGRARIVLDWFRRLRRTLRCVLESADDASADALDEAVAVVPVRLRYRPGHRFDAPPLDAAEPLDRLRLAIATAALEATRLDRSRIRRCGNERCVLLYCDTTKNRSRRWCDMAVCGNRAKASAHYRRHHTSVG